MNFPLNLKICSREDYGSSEEGESNGIWEDSEAKSLEDIGCSQWDSQVQVSALVFRQSPCLPTVLGQSLQERPDYPQ